MSQNTLWDTSNTPSKQLFPPEEQNKDGIKDGIHDETMSDIMELRNELWNNIPSYAEATIIDSDAMERMPSFMKPKEGTYPSTKPKEPFLPKNLWIKPKEEERKQTREIEKVPKSWVIKPNEKQEEKKSPEQLIHELRAWDTIYSIAKKYGLKEDFILRINGITDPTRIPIGQIIRLKEWIVIPDEKKTEKPKWEERLAEWLTKAQHIALILQTCDKLGVTNNAQRAYILATAEHESDHYKTMNEYSKWKNKKYGEKDSSTGYAYYGRWYVQLTWRYNYEKNDPILRWAGLIQQNESIVTNPELVTKPEIAAFILVHGMMNGSFTGRRLGEFINNWSTNWESARKVVNGSDKKRKIAGQAQEIVKQL